MTSFFNLLQTTNTHRLTTTHRNTPSIVGGELTRLGFSVSEACISLGRDLAVAGVRMSPLIFLLLALFAPSAVRRVGMCGDLQ